MATQNPIELEGTFPLPEAQLDRFLLRIRLGYPDQREEMAIPSVFRRRIRYGIWSLWPRLIRFPNYRTGEKKSAFLSR